MLTGRVVALVALLVASIAPAALPGTAAAGRWEEPAQVRILDGGLLPGGAGRLAGIEITMAPGWKTYWRHPGDSGIAPNIDFSGSGNLDGVAVEWPAPELHHDGYGWVVGYADTVILPLLISPVDPALPVDLQLGMHYGVCKEICVPADADLSIRLGEGTPRSAAIEHFRRRVPVAAAGDDPRGGVVSVVKAGEGERARVEVELRLAPESADPFLLVEMPGDWQTVVAEHLGSDGNGIHRFALPVPDGDAALDLRLTAVSDGFSFERTLRLD